ncbi:MAG TPA: hypothetical protein VH660_01720 [Candidatus Deferrimicrobiaceae bacterium]|jgi:hypothetical protein
MTAMADAAGNGVAYRVVEVVDVTDHALEAALNRVAGEGYRFESIHFVTQPGNRRPSMAFLFFTRGGASAGE